jgi:transcriptional regulator with XRE-family HTH domain
MTYSKFDHPRGGRVKLPVQARAAVVREARQGRSYSLEDLAVASGLTVQEISEIELGTNKSLAYFRRLARVLGLPF